MMLWSLLLAGLLGAGAQETPNQSLSITSIDAPAEPNPKVNGQPASEDPAAPESPLRLTPRSAPSRFLASRAENLDNPEPTLAPSRQRTMWWVTTACGLVIVLSVIVICSRLVKKFVPSLANAQAQGPVQLLFRTHLTPKQTVCLVRCGSRLLLVGISGENMQTLTEITDPEEVDYIKGQCLQLRPNSATKTFQEALRKSSDQMEPPIERTVVPQPESKPTTTPEELTRQLGHLRERILSFKGKTQP